MDSTANLEANKAGYTAQDAPSTCLKITGDGPTGGPTDTPSYSDTTAHLKTFFWYATPMAKV